MANRYWVGGSATWNATAGSKWALTSGGAGGQAVPTSSDDVFLDGASGAVTVTAGAALNCKNITFTGFTGTFAQGTQELNVYGNLTAHSGFTWTGSSASVNFYQSSGTCTITSGGQTIPTSLQFGPAGSETTTWSIADALLCSNQISLNAGTLNFNNHSITATNFSSPDANTRTLNFGSSTLTLTGLNTLWNSIDETGFTLNRGTGSIVMNRATADDKEVVMQNSGTLILPDLRVTAGSGNFNTTNARFLGLDFTGFTGTWGATSVDVYGSLVVASGMTVSAGNVSVNMFSTTSATLTFNGKQVARNFTFNGVGGSWTLQDAMDVGTSRTVTLTNGTLNTNGVAVTCGLFSSNNSNTRVLTLGSSTVTCGSTGTVWNFATVTGLTLNGNTGTIVISNTSATGKTFAGGGITYPTVTFSGDNITVSGANTFGTMNVDTAGRTNGLKLTSGVTQTITTTFATNGSLGNLAKLVSSSGGSAATLSKASGTVSVDYMSIQDSTATGGASWYAGANSTNVSGNTGWIFTAPPSTAVKTFNGLAYASTKTVNGLATASVKTINGLA